MKKGTIGYGAFWGLFALLLSVAVCIMGLTPALAAKTAKMDIEVTMTGPRPKMLPAGDDKNHMVGIAPRKGKAVFSDGRKAEYSNVFILDWVRGKSADAWGYTKMAFKDGSWLFFKWESSFAGPDKDGKPTFAGTGTLLKGTGPYKGIKGTVKFKNRQLAPSTQYPKGATRANAVMTYTLP